MFGIYFRSDDGIKEVGSAEEAAHTSITHPTVILGIISKHHFIP